MSNRYIYERDLTIVYRVVDTEAKRTAAVCSSEEYAKLIAKCLNAADAEEKKKQTN